MKLLNFLVCEDIRNEVGNKNTLVGVMDDKLIFNVTPDNKNIWPKRMKLGFFMQIDLEGNIPKSFTFKRIDDEAEQIIGNNIIRVPEKQMHNKITIAIVHSNFTFKKVGKIRFKIEFSDEEANIIDTITPEYSLDILENVIE